MNMKYFVLFISSLSVLSYFVYPSLNRGYKILSCVTDNLETEKEFYKDSPRDLESFRKLLKDRGYDSTAQYYAYLCKSIY